MKQYFDERGNLLVGKMIFHAIIAFFGLIFILWINPFSSVPTGTRGIVTQFGRIIGIQQEGLVILPPWQKLSIMNIRAEQADIDGAEGATSDTQPVNVSLTVRYNIFPDKVAEVYEKYTHNGDLSSYIQTATQEIFKSVTARYTAPDLIAKRPLVSSDINSALRAKLAIYGANVISIDMKSFKFSEGYMTAISSKVNQEQLRLAADNKLKTVESEQRQKVAIAEAEASAVKAKADGDAYAQFTIAKAQAESLRVQNAALAQNKDVLELRRIEVEMKKAETWDGKLPQNIYAGAPIPFLGLSK